MSFATGIMTWTMALALGALWIFVGVNNLTSLPSMPEVHALFVKHVDAVVAARVFPFGLTNWSGATARAVLGVLEVLFGALVLCPRETRLAAFFLVLLGASDAFNAFSLGEPWAPRIGAPIAAAVLFVLAGDKKKHAVAAGEKKKQ